MPNRERWMCLLFLGALTFAVWGCGGGTEESGQAAGSNEVAEAPGPGGGTPAPPDQEELDIEPTGLSLGDNVLDASIASDNLLPPKAFGTWTDLKLVSGQNETTIDSVSIAAGGSTLSLSNVGGSVQWMNGSTALSAYDPAEHGNDCFLMSSNLSGFFASGNSFTYTTSDGSHVATLGPNVSLRLSIRTAATCP